MSKGSYLHVVGCVFVARPGECGTHHDVLVWTPVNAHIILRRICHFAFDMFSSTGTFVCFVNLRMAPVRGMHLTEVAVGVMHTVGRIGKPWFVLTGVVLLILFEITP